MLSIHDPWSAFHAWFQEGKDSGQPEPDAMALATVGLNGAPSVRMVLFRGTEGEGLKFFTNYNSRKSVDLVHCPKAALLFFYPVLQRQIRVEGEVRRAPEAISDTYWKSRPRESQLSSLTSPQSQTIESRSALEAKLDQNRKLYTGEVPRPEYWGGYLLTPNSFEFWQGRPNRFHDRLLFTKERNVWKQMLLAP